MLLSIGIIISFFGYSRIKDDDHAISYSSIIYIISEMDTLFLLAFYSIFVGELNAYIFIAIFIISASIWFLSRESDRSFA